jgi:hypothetical protein
MDKKLCNKTIKLYFILLLFENYKLCMYFALNYIMIKKLITLLVVAFCMVAIIFAQDPPALPTPPYQDPTDGMICLVSSGFLLALEKYSGTNKK